MRHVPVATFKDRVSEFIAEAEAGDEIIITRHGKPAARLIAAGFDKQAMRRDAAEKLLMLGKKVLANHGPTPSEEIRQWIDEGRR